LRQTRDPSLEHGSVGGVLTPTAAVRHTHCRGQDPSHREHRRTQPCFS